MPFRSLRTMEKELFRARTVQIREASSAKGPMAGITVASHILFSCFIRASSRLLLSFNSLNQETYSGRIPLKVIQGSNGHIGSLEMNLIPSYLKDTLPKEHVNRPFIDCKFKTVPP